MEPSAERGYPGPTVPHWQRALEGQRLPDEVADALAERGIGGLLEALKPRRERGHERSPMRYIAYPPKGVIDEPYAFTSEVDLQPGDFVPEHDAWQIVSVEDGTAAWGDNDSTTVVRRLRTRLAVQSLGEEPSDELET